MRLLAKFSLIFAVVFGLGLAAAAFLFHDSLQRSAREQVLHEAQIMMETALAMRNYTTEQIRPVMNEISQPYDAKADRKSTRLNSSHLVISYAVFCLKKKKKTSVPVSSLVIVHDGVLTEL